MTFKGIGSTIMETDQEEVERLASAPEGSTNRLLSELPINVRGELRGRVIHLPPRVNGNVVVVPFQAQGPSSRRPDGRIQRNGNWWEVVVVASDNLSYPVGGHNLVVVEAELIRGTVVDLDDILAIG